MSDPYTDLADSIEKILISLVENKEISLETSGLLLTTINIQLKNIQNLITEDLEKKINEWEASMGEDDKSLYSLGLRHALDIVGGVVPTDPQPKELTEEEIPWEGE